MMAFLADGNIMYGGKPVAKNNSTIDLNLLLDNPCYIYSSANFYLISTIQGGGHSAHRHMGGQSKNFTGHPKISAHFQKTQKYQFC